MFVKWHTNKKLSVQKHVQNSTKEYFSNGLVSQQSKQSYVFGTDSTPPTSPRCGNGYQREFIWFSKSFSQYVGPLQQQICLHKMWQWPLHNVYSSFMLKLMWPSLDHTLSPALWDLSLYFNATEAPLTEITCKLRQQGKRLPNNRCLAGTTNQ